MHFKFFKSIFNDYHESIGWDIQYLPDNQRYDIKHSLNE